MIRDLDQIGDVSTEYDVCIVGSGPAGTSLAAELADSGLRICVLESGLSGPTRRGDALRVVASDGISIKDYSRERVLGGASTTWAGLSAPLDPVDLGPRPELAEAGAADPEQWRRGWPLSREELVPFWEAAAERYRFPTLSAFGLGGFDRLKGRGDAPPEWQGLDEKVFMACAEPQNFGKEFADLYAGEAVDLWLDATLLELQASPGESASSDSARDGGTDGDGAGGDRPRIRQGVVLTRGRHRCHVKAAVFVLACGGLENARLLLTSQDLCKQGLGNEHDQVGRHLMNHPKNYHGVIRLTKPVRDLPWLFGCLHGGYAGYAGLRLTDERLRERGLLNAYVRFEPLFPWSGNLGIEAFVTLVKHSGGLFRRWKSKREDDVVMLRDYSETGDDSDLANQRFTALRAIKLAGIALINLVPVMRYIWSRLRDGRAPLVKRVRLRNFMEMEPHPNNRVTLDASSDPDGRPRTRVTHDSSDLDRRSLLALHTALADELKRNGFGTLEGALTESSLAEERRERWPIDHDASHHMGTTRMGHDPATSVVDAQCRLHSVDNVYLAGTSVFPTSGCANPTFTLVALSIRLAAHLRTAVFGLPAVPVLKTEPAAEVIVTSPAERAAACSAEARSVLVIGAGRRVTTDVLPAFASLPADWRVDGVFARTPRPLAAAGEGWEVQSLDALSADTLAAADLIHLAVSKQAVPRVLAQLARHDLSSTDLLIDTPVLLLKHMGQAKHLSAFRNVWVAEDITRLPWLDVVAAARASTGAPRELRCEHSAWRYHGLALAKTLLGSQRISSARRRKGERGDRVELRFDNGTRAVILEPRDYAGGRLILRSESGGWSDAPRADEDLAALEMLVTDERVTGFRLGEHTAALTPEESALLGPVSAGESLTARTEDLKRVGLRRMLSDIAAGRGGYALAEGLDDMVIDALLEKARIWYPSPLSRAGSPVFRGAMGLVGKLAPGD